MRVLLQNTQTRLYYAAPGQWTEHLANAFDFEQVERAAQVYSLEDLPYAQIILDGTPPRVELPRFSIPISKAA